MHRLDLYVQCLGPLRGVGRATDVVFGGITPALVDSPRRRSRVVEHVALRMEVGVGTLADLVVCGLGCKTSGFRVFSCSIKHCFAYFSLFCLFKVLFSPFPPLTRGDLLCVSNPDLVRILGSTRGWFPCTSFRFRFSLPFFKANTSLFASRIMEARDSHMQPRVPVPICSLSQGTQPFVGPLASPEMVSLRPELGVLSQLRFRDPDHFRAGMIHDCLPVLESLLADFDCSTVDFLKIV